jgi:hypothetical protein
MNINKVNLEIKTVNVFAIHLINYFELKLDVAYFFRLLVCTLTFPLVFHYKEINGSFLEKHSYTSLFSRCTIFDNTSMTFLVP